MIRIPADRVPADRIVDDGYTFYRDHEATLLQRVLRRAGIAGLSAPFHRSAEQISGQRLRPQAAQAIVGV